MITRDSIYFDYFPDWTLAALIRECPWFVTGYDCILTCLDSNPRTGLWPDGPILNHGNSSRFGPYLVAPGELIAEFASQLFSGFDEVFIVERESWRNLQPTIWREHWTTERAHADGPLPEDLVRTLTESSAVRYAADGDGLNVACGSAEEIARVRTAIAT